MGAQGEKQCTFCGETKPYADFCRKSKSKDGYNCHCRDCASYKKKLAHGAAPDKVREQKRQSYHRNKLRMAEQRREQRYVEALAANRKWFAENKERRAEYESARNRTKARKELGWKRRGIDCTWEQYEELLEAQGGCGGCGYVPSAGEFLCVDHNHATGRIRGLLCHSCNVALGNMKDNPELLRRLADWIEGRETKMNVYMKMPELRIEVLS